MTGSIKLWQALAGALLVALATWLGGQPSPFSPKPVPPPPAPGTPDVPPVVVPPVVVPPVVVPPPTPKADPARAIARIQFGSSGCSATVIGPRRDDGKWWVLTASHCIDKIGMRGQMRMLDGRVMTIVSRTRDIQADCCWCETDGVVEQLPFANIAGAPPPVGTPVWHAGYGVDRPGNREEGVIEGRTDSKGQIRMRLSVSSGDSGGGIFRVDTGELVSCVCCTAMPPGTGTTWGAGPEAIRRAQPTAMMLDDWQPIGIPRRDSPPGGWLPDPPEKR